jgi:hypothetical protein
MRLNKMGGFEMTTTEKDLALVRRVAELMGIAHKVSACKYGGEFVEILDPKNPGNGGEYNPLTNDAQCFAVLMRMREAGAVLLMQKDGCTWMREERGSHENAKDNTAESLRRAILECFVKGSKS